MKPARCTATCLTTLRAPSFTRHCLFLCLEFLPDGACLPALPYTWITSPSRHVSSFCRFVGAAFSFVILDTVSHIHTTNYDACLQLRYRLLLFAVIPVPYFLSRHALHRAVICNSLCLVITDIVAHTPSTPGGGRRRRLSLLLVTVYLPIYPPRGPALLHSLPRCYGRAKRRNGEWRWRRRIPILKAGGLATIPSRWATATRTTTRLQFSPLPTSRCHTPPSRLHLPPSPTVKLLARTYTLVILVTYVSRDGRLPLHHSTTTTYLPHTATDSRISHNRYRLSPLPLLPLPCHMPGRRTISFFHLPHIGGEQAESEAFGRRMAKMGLHKQQRS